MARKTALLIMAAGMGSRYGGDKQVDGIGPHGEALMQYSIYDAVRAGFDKIVFVIKPQHKETIDGFCRHLSGVETVCAYQDFSSLPSFYAIPAERAKPFGTVHAVLSAKDVLDCPFAVINADDYYGPDAFSAMREALIDLEEGEAAMVGYRLRNTVSRNGSVTRGLCRVRDGRLEKVKETYRIVVREDGSLYDEAEGVLDPEALVSMNLWGFRGELLETMEEAFFAFLKALSPEDIKAEYALPSFVDQCIQDQTVSVRVLSTESAWFGVTYREDRPLVAERLSRMHQSGLYPSEGL